MLNDPNFLDQMRFRMDWYGQRATELDQEQASEGGIKRQDLWRRRYYAFPYMIGSTDTVVKQRFFDTFLNVWDLNERGQLTPRTDDSLWEKFTHALEESGRGCLTTADTQSAADFIHGYWESGAPIGLEPLKACSLPEAPVLVKYSKLRFLEDMLNHGRIRLCPASEYQAQIHNFAIRDSELERSMMMPTFKERLAGKTEITFEGKCFEFGTGDLEIPVCIPNYYVCCLSQSVFYRLPTDFEAEGALVIKKPKLFEYLLKRAFAEARKGYRPISGQVNYYDPYTDQKTVLTSPPMAKHLRYSYQREYRIAFLPCQQAVLPDVPIFLEIGSMRDYAVLITF